MFLFLCKVSLVTHTFFFFKAKRAFWRGRCCLHFQFVDSLVAGGIAGLLRDTWQPSGQMNLALIDLQGQWVRAHQQFSKSMKGWLEAPPSPVETPGQRPLHSLPSTWNEQEDRARGVGGRRKSGHPVNMWISGTQQMMFYVPNITWNMLAWAGSPLCHISVAWSWSLHWKIPLFHPFLLLLSKPFRVTGNNVVAPSLVWLPSSWTVASLNCCVRQTSETWKEKKRTIS